MNMHDEPVLPYGGIKESGWGRFNAEEGLNEYLVTKSVTSISSNTITGQKYKVGWV